MSGLDKMKARILEEARDTAGNILAQAQSDAEEAVRLAEESAKGETENILARAKRDAQEHAQRVESAADMQRKQAILATKQEMIGKVLDAAYDAVLALDDGKYFELLEKLLKEHVLAEDGVICFSGRDLARMPEGFREKIGRIAAEKGGSLKISETPEKIDGGFLLVYGGIEENCTVRAVFDSRRDELSDEMNRLLFG